RLMRRQVIADLVNRFDWELAKALPRLSLDEEREVRAMFAQLASYEDYTSLMKRISIDPIAESDPAKESDSIDTTP
ncbi:hypothetical protein SB912_30090, partial [Pantoea sp. SIMBA_072]